MAWNMYGLAHGFFERGWRDAPIPVTPISHALNAAIAKFAPFVCGGKSWTMRTATVLGILMALWAPIGVLFVSKPEVSEPCLQYNCVDD